MIYDFRNIPKRYYVILLVFVSDMLKSSITTSPVLVIAETTTNRKIILHNETKIIPAEFDWSPAERSIALGVHAIGPIFAAFTGTLVHRIGGANFLGIGMLGVAILTITDPFAMKIHVHLFTAVRLFFGFSEGLTFIGNTDVLTRWVPPNERVRATTFSFLGYAFGLAVSFPMTGFIIQNLGWPCVFYILGVITLIWCIIWMSFVSSNPSTDRFITEKERVYLSAEITCVSEKKIDIPYKKIFTSVPIYALLNEFFVTFNVISFFKFLPLYIRDLYDVNIQAVGLISGIPLASGLVAKPILACFADYVRSSGYSIGKLHKWFLFCGKSLAIFFYLLSAFSGSIISCVVYITLAQISFSSVTVSHSSILIDVTGQYASFIQSFMIVVTSSASFLNSIILGLLTKNHTRSEWNTYLMYISSLILFGLITFQIFGSGELQPWAKLSPKESANKMDETDRNNEINLEIL